MYLIPSRAVASRLRILLRTYKKYIVGNAAGLLGASADTARTTAVMSQSAERVTLAALGPGEDGCRLGPGVGWGAEGVRRG